VKDSFRVERIPSIETYEWLLKKHYAKRIPSISYAFGLFEGKKLVGVCTFGSPPSRALCVGLCGKEYVEQVLELNRLCVESKEKNITSYFVGKCLKDIKDYIVVSYADTSQGHIGKIYQATNFLYTGLSDKRTEWRMIGSNKHSKTISEKYTLEERKSSDKFEVVDRPRKHRYVFMCGNKTFKKKIRKALKYKVVNYPKGETQRYNAEYQPISQGLLF